MADKKDKPKVEASESTLVPKIDLQEIGGGFVKQYYDLFGNDRTKLETYYRDPSCLSYEGQGYQGTQKIMNKLRVKTHIMHI